MDARTIKHVTEIPIDEIIDEIKTIPIVKTRNKGQYINIPCSFDIETSSFYQNGEKKAIMYLWTFDINGCTCHGRTWDEFYQLLVQLIERLELSDKRYLVIYVHNLGYEFQFMQYLFEWESVFARKARKPMKAVTCGIEFRDSLVLSGYSLSKVAENLHSHKIKKLVGDLDYDLVRHSETPLSKKELQYAYNDVIILEYYIHEEIERNGDITKIPLTQTGYTRRYVKNRCYNRDDSNAYVHFRDLMQSMTIEPEEYISLKRAFMGGFTHANAFNVMRVHNSVDSVDFSSSYPAVMLTEMFPMAKGYHLDNIESERQYQNLCESNCLIFDIEINDLEQINFADSPLSASKCFELDPKNTVYNNGRIVYAAHLITTLTNVDFEYFWKFYNCKKYRIWNVWCYPKSYLPTPFISAMLDLFKDKTELKGILEKEVEYMHSKQLLNSMYGMSVTDIAPDNVKFDNGWTTEKCDIIKEIKAYNNQKQRFLFYPWGVFVTAYARRNLFTGIYNAGSDYIYADTDSVKMINYDQHLDYIEAYNENIIEKTKDAMNFHNIPYEYATPRDKKGQKHYLGVWEHDAKYSQFKTLGAKRYLCLEDGKYKLTVSGVDKKLGAQYIVDHAKEKNANPFDVFNEDLIIPKGKGGRKILTYIDEPIDGEITDYLGNTAHYHEESCVHMEDGEYTFNIAESYATYLAGLEESEET